MNKKYDSPIWIVLNFLAIIVMIFGIVAGIIIIVKMDPTSGFNDIIKKYDLQVPDNPLRWVYGIGSMLLGLSVGFLLVAVGQITKTIDNLKTKI